MDKIITYKNNIYKTGDSVVFTIDGNIVLGKIFIRNISNDRSYTRCYVCHNNPNYNGDNSPEMLGFEYSWSFSVENNNPSNLNSDVEIISPDIESKSKEDYFISDKLISFFNTQELSIVKIVLEKENIFPLYNKFEVSDTKGLIKLTNSEKNRFVEIKMGRFLTSVFKQMKDISNIDVNLTNSDIEKIYNNFISYQSDDYIKINTVSGDDILEGYKRENYHNSKSSLGGSCMTDKLNFLKLYTQNPEVVSMMMIKTFDKIVGRCLIWTTTNGEKVMDKRYTCDDWVISKFDSIQKEMKLLDYSDCYENKMIVQLTNNNFNQYPYLDTFKIYDNESKSLCSFMKDDESIEGLVALNTTCGETSDNIR
jgi:hypothetical protein